jgi:hypothetical protein
VSYAHGGTALVERREPIFTGSLRRLAAPLQDVRGASAPVGQTLLHSTQSSSQLPMRGTARGPKPSKPASLIAG